MKKIKKSFILGSFLSLAVSGSVLAYDNSPPPPEACPGGVVLLGWCQLWLK